MSSPRPPAVSRVLLYLLALSSVLCVDASPAAPTRTAALPRQMPISPDAHTYPSQLAPASRTFTPTLTLALPTNPALYLSAPHPATTLPPSSSHTRTPPLFLVVTLATTLTISDYPPYHNLSRPYFPKYSALPDGSLTTPLLRHDMAKQTSRLLLIGALLMLFTRNTLVSLDYIRRGRVKDKTLFYLLFASQIFGPVCFLSLIVGFVNQDANCAAVNQIAAVSVEISQAIMISGILGIKAFHCLNRSRIVLCVIAAFQLASLILFCLEIPNWETKRRLTGTCSATGQLKYMPVSVALTFGETIFICVCFLIALCKSSRFAFARGRMSITIPDSPVHTLGSRAVDGMGMPEKRGWWDYVPERDGFGAEERQRQGEREREQYRKVGVIDRFRARIDGVFSSSGTYDPVKRRGSLPSDQLSAPRMTEAVGASGNRASDDPGQSYLSSTSLHENAASSTAGGTGMENHGSPSRAPSVRTMHTISGTPMRSFSARRPRIMQLRAVLKDELFLTVGVAVSSVITSTLSLVHAYKHDTIHGPSVIMDINWAVISLLIMHSYSKVIRRHEKEEILHAPLERYPYGLSSTIDSRHGSGPGPGAQRSDGSSLSQRSRASRRSHINLNLNMQTSLWNPDFSMHRRPSEVPLTESLRSAASAEYMRARGGPAGAGSNTGAGAGADGGRRDSYSLSTDHFYDEEASTDGGHSVHHNDTGNMGVVRLYPPGSRDEYFRQLEAASIADGPIRPPVIPMVPPAMPRPAMLIDDEDEWRSVVRVVPSPSPVPIPAPGSSRAEPGAVGEQVDRSSAVELQEGLIRLSSL
ncbi:hypothetical protein BOTBODRAFT_60341 [Botryobasidium botryosum FD-172 SS1]|uniref:Uncharacterized protein n=1 Tax=Botryobasidium botryosum (strain FD-172 SS1) TaxID=930990 RepID=A0A067LUZ9_BOTB1|nr:hypothetical protein BOTBODRAFT_60341 [Botryobasidium botryosum FD-172 SS1]